MSRLQFTVVVPGEPGIAIVYLLYTVQQDGTELSEMMVCSRAIHRRFEQANDNELPYYEPKVSDISVQQTWNLQSINIL